jgi:hypothetical protein
MDSKVTIITGLWDLKRGEIEGWGKRDFQTYKDRFFELLKSPVQMAIFIPESLREEVVEVRQKYPTKIYTKELRDFKLYNPFFKKINEIRTDPKWVGQAGWLAESPQAQLEYYNPMMMSKMFMVNEIATINPFNSEYFYWIDGGLSATVHQGYFNHDDVFNVLPSYSDEINKFVFLQYPYEANNEIHGFERKKIAEYCNVDFVDKISRGGFWGGKKEHIHQVHGLYYYYLANTLSEGYMGADESLNTILSYRHPELIHNFELGGDGLCWPFFENLKEYLQPAFTIKENKTALYVLTFNSPKQFETLIESFKQYDSDYLDLPEKYLINNSTKKGVARAYNKLCKDYGFTQIKKKNIGICGGRQFIAEHFDTETQADYYLFFEDDMFFYNGEETTCRNGFTRKIPELYRKSLEIVFNESFDFLKLNFSEFFGDNSKQWAWHNVSAQDRKMLFPDNPVKETGDTEAAPFKNYKHIKSYEGIPYATGEVYYCNWPQIVSREGNKKMFLDTKWDYPYEQTWMSHMYQETVKGNLNPGILLATPTEHDRFEFYPGEERREH